MFGTVPLMAALLLGAAQQEVAAARDGPEPDLTLTGTITGREHQSYVSVPFKVPAGVREVSVVFDYDRTGGTVIDLGLVEQGDRVRGWSGGNKARFVIGDARATPSYLPGPVAGRTLGLLLGVPNARAGSNTRWRAEVRFARGSVLPSGPRLRARPGWYRGELHSHSGHSDGSCDDGKGTRVPCPLYRTVEAAARAGLDFIAITDHNTVSHLSEMEALQPAFPDLLLIPGQEVTTFQGHANVFGPAALADFRLGSQAVPDGRAWSRAVGSLGGTVSINHPGLPSGEACMGCGWTMSGIDWNQVHAVEVVNGGAIASAGGRAETIISGVPFWESQLSQGRQLTPVAGSDNHDPTLRSPDPRAIGRTTTVVWADDLSVQGVVKAIRRGRVFVDLRADPAHVLDLSSSGAHGAAEMGGRLTVPSGTTVPFRLHVAGCAGCTAELIVNGKILTRRGIRTADEVATFTVPVGEGGWVRAQVRDALGELLMIGNAVQVDVH